MEDPLLVAQAPLSGDATTSENRREQMIPAPATHAPGSLSVNGKGPGDDDDDDDGDVPGGSGGNIEPDDDEGYDDDDDDDEEEPLQVSRCGFGSASEATVRRAAPFCGKITFVR